MDKQWVHKYCSHELTNEEKKLYQNIYIYIYIETEWTILTYSWENLIKENSLYVADYAVRGNEQNYITEKLFLFLRVQS